MTREPIVQVRSRRFAHGAFDIILGVATALEIIRGVSLFPAEPTEVAERVIE